MTPEQIEFFNDYDRLFQSGGWSRLTQDLKAEYEQLPLNGFLNAKSFEELTAMRIRYELLGDLLGLPDSIRRQQEEVVAQSVEAENE